MLLWLLFLKVLNLTIGPIPSIPKVELEVHEKPKKQDTLDPTQAAIMAGAKGVSEDWLAFHIAWSLGLGYLAGIFTFRLIQSKDVKPSEPGKPIPAPKPSADPPAPKPADPAVVNPVVPQPPTANNPRDVVAVLDGIGRAHLFHIDAENRLCWRQWVQPPNTQRGEWKSIPITVSGEFVDCNPKNRAIAAVSYYVSKDMRAKSEPAAKDDGVVIWLFYVDASNKLCALEQTTFPALAKDYSTWGPKTLQSEGKDGMLHDIVVTDGSFLDAVVATREVVKETGKDKEKEKPELSVFYTAISPFKKDNQIYRSYCELVAGDLGHFKAASFGAVPV